MDIATLRRELTSRGQSDVLRFYDKLPESGRKKLEGQLAALDLGSLGQLADEYVKRKPEIHLPKDIQPVKTFPRRPGPDQEKLYRDAAERGRQLLREGKVGAFLVAGGQGTRLGYDGPKGEYPVTPIKSKPLFQVFAEQLLNWSRTSGKPVPWYIMTSDINDGPTREFFRKNNHFGYEASNITFFEKG